jgi:hypothetical protein
MMRALHHQAGYLYDEGEVAAALDVETRVIDKVAGQEGADKIPAAFAHRLGLLKVRLQETEDGLEWIDRAIARAMSTEGPRVHIAALLARARANLFLNRTERVLADIEAAERLAQPSADGNRDLLRSALLLRADFYLAGGEAARALQEIDALLTEIGYPNKRVANQLALMVITKARAQLELGDGAAALGTAQDALALARANAPNPERSATVGAALLTLAEAQRASGDQQAALASARLAASALAIGLGPNHSETRAALKFN